MTHEEALEGNRIGLPPSACAGELVPRGRYRDWHLVPGSSPPVLAERTVEVLRCEACRTYVPMADGVALNAYAVGEDLTPGGAAAMVSVLAGAMDGRGDRPEDVP